MLEATGVAFDWDVRQAGVDVMEERGHAAARRDPRLDQAQRCRDQGPDHDADRHRLPVRQRRAASRARPVRVRSARASPTAGVRSRYEGVDLVVVRENTEDLYAGIEFEAGTDDAAP